MGIAAIDKPHKILVIEGRTQLWRPLNLKPPRLKTDFVSQPLQIGGWILANFNEHWPLLLFFNMVLVCALILNQNLKSSALTSPALLCKISCILCIYYSHCGVCTICQKLATSFLLQRKNKVIASGRIRKIERTPIAILWVNFSRISVEVWSTIYVTRKYSLLAQIWWRKYKFSYLIESAVSFIS